VTFDRQTGIGAAGGYTGEGVGASNLAARILADLVLDRDTPLTRLAWVDDVPDRWPVEPFRWLGAKTAFALGRLADRKELRGEQRSRVLGPLFDWFF
jgi:glycine/D-amino acid oxidase-like deaminating enzyme